LSFTDHPGGFLETEEQICTKIFLRIKRIVE